jgi:hypothetical protein
VLGGLECVGWCWIERGVSTDLLKSRISSKQKKKQKQRIQGNLRQESEIKTKQLLTMRFQMKIAKTESGKTTVKMSRADWERIGKQAGWASDEEIARRVKFVNRLVGDLKQAFGGSVMDTRKAYKYFEVASENNGRMYVQVYYNADNESFGVERYYDSEVMQDEYGKSLEVPAYLNDYDKTSKEVFQKVQDLLR